MSQTSLASFGEVPQDPFLPRVPPQGPSFLDTEACLCALQDSPESGGGSGDAKWQCIGNQTDGVYVAKGGKWFNSQRGGATIPKAIFDASNPPDTGSAQSFDAATGRLGPVDLGKLNVWDKACTAENRTSFSTSYYRAADQQSKKQVPVDAIPCWRPGAVPIQIQGPEGPDGWNAHGCPLGFLCKNNTVNSLPQFCPPIKECQMARLGGIVCQDQGLNIGMGPFEPVVCQQGFYCPPGGKEMLPCPAGSYCQPGAATPTPCNFGSSCPEGSQFQRYYIPLAVLIVVDVLLVLGTILYTIRSRVHSNSKMHHAALGKPRAMGALTRGMSYKPLPEELHDQEMAPMHATYMPTSRYDGWMGFEAALDVHGGGGAPRQAVDSEDSGPMGMAAGAGAGGGDDDDSDGGPAAAGTGEAGYPPQLRAFVESMRKATATADFGISFGYTDLGFKPRGSAKPILQNVTGSIEAGTLTAVMGGSGAGKSTFVNVLMGKTINTGGAVSVNNIPGKIKRYKKLIGYVPQDDVVLPELTVFENILHSARVRLPSSWDDREIVQHVDAVIDCLELSHVRDSLVGSVGKPVISGGQRKRVSIGMELAAAPMAIFLDEPTSGLDATAASSIMRTLKALARLGITVIVIIHQPRMEIFEMLDNLILLANGQIIYEGPETAVQRFFEDIGFAFPKHGNFGDVVTDIITGNGRQYKNAGDISKDSLVAHWADAVVARSRRGGDSSNNKHTSSSSLSSTLDLTSNINSMINNRRSMRPVRQLIRRRGASRPKQVWLCLQRSMIQQYRTKSAFWFEMVLASIAGFLLGIAMSSKKGVFFIGFYRPPLDVLSIATDLESVPQLALLMAIAIGLISAAPGVRTFSEELLLQRREAEAGHSRLAYFIAKLLSVIPRMVMQCLHFTVLVLILALPIIDWGTAFITNLLYFYCIYGLSNFISMITRREDAPLFSTMISLIVGILCGAAPTLAQVEDWNFLWLWRASPSVWLAEVYFGRMVAPFGYLYDTKQAGDASGYHLDWLSANLGILAAIGSIYRVLAYVGLFFGTRLRV